MDALPTFLHAWYRVGIHQTHLRRGGRKGPIFVYPSPEYFIREPETNLMGRTRLLDVFQSPIALAFA